MSKSKSNRKRQGGRAAKWRSDLRYCLMLGFWAGMIWGGLHWLLYELAFTDVLPGFLADPFYKRVFLATWKGHVIGLLFFIGFSVAAALVYRMVLLRLRGVMPGVLYGLAWWAVLFLWLGPMLDMSKAPGIISWRSLATEACVLAMWGLFIGYSLVFAYTNVSRHEPPHPIGSLLKP